MTYMHGPGTKADLRAPSASKIPTSRTAYMRKDGPRSSDDLTELSHADRIAMIGRLAASIPHEVNQPITAMMTNAQAALRLLDSQPPDLEEVRQALGCIVQDGDRACNVIGCMRALIKKAAPRRDWLDINRAIREVIELTYGEAVKNGVSVEAELGDGLPLIQGDRVHLQQVILNLVINAIEAMSSVSEGQRELLINSSKGEAGLRVTVRDSGPGLASETFEQAFDAFYTTKPNGLGLGLSICRSIIEAHGGRLWASPNKTRGVTFQFVVPEAGPVGVRGAYLQNRSNGTASNLNGYSNIGYRCNGADLETVHAWTALSQ